MENGREMVLYFFGGSYMSTMGKQMDSKFFIIYSLMLVHLGILRKFMDSTSLFAPHSDAVRIMRIILTVRLLRMMRLMQKTNENSMDAKKK